MASLGRLWGSSLLFRRIVAASIFVLACLLVYLGSNIPRSVSLPDDDLNAKSFARLGEEKIVLEKPDIQEGGLALSYVGSKNEVADLWLTNATLDEGSRRLLLPGSKLQQPAVVSYITGGQTKSAPTDDTCHTTIEVRRAPGSPPIDALTLYQSDESAGPQRFRQIVLNAGTTPMQVEVHTDPPPQGGMDAPGCNKMLTVGTNPPIEMPPIPVRFLVSGGKIDLHFNPSSPAVSIWTGTAQTFESVSLGDNNPAWRGAKGFDRKTDQGSAKARSARLARGKRNLVQPSQARFGYASPRCRIRRREGVSLPGRALDVQLRPDRRNPEEHYPRLRARRRSGRVHQLGEEGLLPSPQTQTWPQVRIRRSEVRLLHRQRIPLHKLPLMPVRIDRRHRAGRIELRDLLRREIPARRAPGSA